MEGRQEARDNYKNWAALEEISWRQKSREIWLKEGDRNTNFFFFPKMANMHRRLNHISRIKVSGIWLNEEMEIKERVLNAYKNLFFDEGEWRPSAINLDFK